MHVAFCRQHTLERGTWVPSSFFVSKSSAYLLVKKKIFPRAKDRVMCKLLWFELHFGHNSILFYSSLPPVLSNAKKKKQKPSNLSDHNHQLKLVMLMCLGLNLKLNCENSVISSPCNNILASCIKNSPFMWIYWKITPK